MLINEERIWGFGIILILLFMWLITYLINQHNFRNEKFLVLEDDEDAKHENMESR